MMRKRLLLFVYTLLTLSVADAQKAVIEESVVDVECMSPTHVVQHFKEVTTILSEQGASLATFVCSCSKNVFVEGRDNVCTLEDLVVRFNACQPCKFTDFRL